MPRIMGSIAGKRILLGVTGGIAAYKVVDWLRTLKKEGAVVTVVMTEAGSRFVSPLTFAALSGNKVYGGMFEQDTAEQIPHISLARDHDLLMVAPATANTIARLAHGLADDLLSTVILATRKKVLVFPAMNSNMYDHPATQANLARLREFGYLIVEPASGMLACGDEGPGRLPDWDTAREAVYGAFASQDLAGKKVLITAGPTREALDPVRYLGNRSSGRMGYSLARIARRRGAEVVLVSGPTSLPPVPGVEMIRVETAQQMREAVLARCAEMSVVIKAAAVADYRPAEVAGHKLKKSAGGLQLNLVYNQDILKELGERKKDKPLPVLVGFAAESREHLAEGRRKLIEKNLDLMVVNDIMAEDAGFEVETNRITLIDRHGSEDSLPLLSKDECADRIWDRVVALL